MGVDIIKLDGVNQILTYRIPLKTDNIDNNIGNSIEDFQILEILGSGTFGYIAKVKSKINHRIYALKKNDLEKLDIKKKNRIKNEIIFLRRLKHKNICQYITSFNQDFYIVMDFYNNKDLLNYFCCCFKLKQKIKEDILWNIFAQCIEGLKYIHSLGMIHLDIKLDNILMDDSYNIAICDFGISSVMTQKDAFGFTNNSEQMENLIVKYGEILGTQHFMAPEVEKCQKYNQKADVYSLGICFYLLCYQTFPYLGGKNMPELLNDNDCPPTFMEVIMKMIKKDPEERGDIFEISDLFKKGYIKKYVKNSGIFSVGKCLLSYENFVEEFSKNQNVELNKNSKMKISLIMKKMVKEKHIEENCYDIRNFINDYEMKFKDNEEISPLICINIILKHLNYELNESIYRLGIQENQEIPFFIPKEDSSIAYKDYMEGYKNINNSFITRNFEGVLKLTKQCTKCNKLFYSFEKYRYILFKLKAFRNEINSQTLNIYDFFTSLNSTKKSIGLNKYVTCSFCNTTTQQIETKSFYDVPKNLIIIFEYDKKNQKKIDFDENIIFNQQHVEHNFGIEYYCSDRRRKWKT